MGVDQPSSLQAGKPTVEPERRARSRRASDSFAGPARAATLARWPLSIDSGLETATRRDPFVAIVRDSVADYCAGRADRASQRWAEDIVWRVSGSSSVAGEMTGAEAIFEYHRRLDRLSEGTFRQELLALLASNGPIVAAHLRTTATRGDRRLDVPTLVLFEVARGEIRAVTEIPGDLSAWDGFWAD